MNEIAREWVEKAELVVPAEMAERAFESATSIREYMRGKLEIGNK